MASRVIHTEVAFNLDTDSFILALRILVARRGDVRSILLTIEVISMVRKEN